MQRRTQNKLVKKGKKRDKVKKDMREMKRSLVNGLKNSEEFQALNSMRETGTDYTMMFKLDYTDE
jgi:hypothetical protein